MQFKYEGLNKTIDIPFLYVVYSCLLGNDMPIDKESLLTKVRVYTPIDGETSITFIRRWFNRLDIKEDRDRGEELISILFKDIFYYKKLITYITSSPLILGIACSQWERAGLPDRSIGKGNGLEYWMDVTLCEHILYPIEVKERIEAWYLKFYMDLATYYSIPILNNRELYKVARTNGGRDIDVEMLCRLIAKSGLLFTEDGSNYLWVDRKIPLRLRGIPSAITYWYRVNKTVNSIFKEG
jgi:hypothetical protein